ncbi:MAG: hypothetical protein ACK4Q5_06035 [Saprospiraceae bacterium]
MLNKYKVREGQEFEAIHGPKLPYGTLRFNGITDAQVDVFKQHYPDDFERIFEEIKQAAALPEKAPKAG